MRQRVCGRPHPAYHAPGRDAALLRADVPWTLFGSVLGRGFHRHEDPPVAFGRELDVALGERKQRVIRAHADVRAGVPARAALAHENVAGQHALAAVAFNAKPPARRVAAVARGAACLLVCHGRKSLEWSLSLSRPQAPMISLMRTVVCCWR